MAKMDAWEKEGYDKLIKEMKTKGIDVSEYMNLNYFKLLKIDTAICNGLDVTKIYRKGYKGLSVAQMDSVIHGMKEGLNVDIYNRKDIKADIMNYVFRAMKEAKKIGLSPNNIDNIGINALKEVLDKDETEKKAKASKPLTKEQQKYIDRMKSIGIDTLALGYESPTIKPGILREITLGHENGADVSKYYRKGYKLREWQCKEIRLAMEAGVDPTELNKKDLTPDKMANRRLWLQYTTEDQRKIAESINPEYKDDTVMRRILSLNEIKDNNDLIPLLLKPVPVKKSFYYSDESHLYLPIFRALLLLSMPYMKGKQDTFSNLVEDFDKYYDNVMNEYINLLYKADSIRTDSDKRMKDFEYANHKYRQEKLNKYFIDNMGVNLKELFYEFQKQEPKTENRQYENVITDFKREYFGEETETIWSQWG